MALRSWQKVKPEYSHRRGPPSRILPLTNRVVFHFSFSSDDIYVETRLDEHRHFVHVSQLAVALGVRT
jgi:hypothetical protein